MNKGFNNNSPGFLTRGLYVLPTELQSGFNQYS